MPALPTPAGHTLIRVTLIMMIGLISSTSCGESDGGSTLLVPDTSPSAGSILPFNIQLRLIGDQTSTSQQTLFNNAAYRWGQTITQDLPDVSVSLPAGSCLSGSPPVNQGVDDLLIDISLIPIDGEGGVLGQAGPCSLRSDTLLPVYGGIELDQADVALLEEQELLDEVILHEMGHVLGIGTLWDDQGLLVDVFSLNPQYIGEQGIAQFEQLGGSGSVPVENRGGIGTRADHWRESIFQTELMTGMLNSGTSNPLSVITLGSLVDIGYSVDLDQADPYSLPGDSMVSTQQIELLERPLTTPLLLLTQRGEILQRIQR